MRTFGQNFILHSSKVALAVIALTGVSACVTQSYDAEDKPVVDKDFSDNQLAKTRISLALGYLDMGNTAQAKYNLEKAKQFSPNSVDVYTAFAHYYESVGEYEQTEESYLTALSIEDEDADTLNNFGVFLCRQNRVDEAEVYFLKAIEVPTYIRVSESYENIALCHIKVNQFGKAESALKRSIAHSPNSSSSLMQMAQLQYAKQDYNESANYLSRFELATRKFTPQAIALAYKVQSKLGNQEIANNYATMLLKMFPESNESKQYLDNELAEIGADKLALEYKKYVLLKSGAKVDKKPIVVLTKAKPKANINDGFKQKKPKININERKLVDDATIAKQTGQSIAANSQIAKNTNTPVVTTQPVTQAPVKSKSSNNATSNVATTSNTRVNTAAPSTPVTQPPVAVNTTPKRINIADLDEPRHIVKKGENLYQISMKYNITISTLRRWNDLTNENIHVGQELRLTKPN